MRGIVARLEARRNRRCASASVLRRRGTEGFRCRSDARRRRRRAQRSRVAPSSSSAASFALDHGCARTFTRLMTSRSPADFSRSRTAAISPALIASPSTRGECCGVLDHGRDEIEPGSRMRWERTLSAWPWRSDATAIRRKWGRFAQLPHAVRIRKRSIQSGDQAAFFSRSCFHWPIDARPFIRARCANTRCAAATFSDLPDHAFCGACWSARP